MRATNLPPSSLYCPSFLVEGKRHKRLLSFEWKSLIWIGHYSKYLPSCISMIFLGINQKKTLFSDFTRFVDVNRASEGRTQKGRFSLPRYRLYFKHESATSSEIIGLPFYNKSRTEFPVRCLILKNAICSHMLVLSLLSEYLNNCYASSWKMVKNNACCSSSEEALLMKVFLRPRR